MHLCAGIGDFHHKITRWLGASGFVTSTIAEQVTKDESIDSAFARFNTIITSVKALDEGYFSKNYVRKFLRALHPQWRAKVTTNEKSKDLTSLSLDELIGNLKVHEMIIKKVFEIVKAKVERKYIALKAKKESSDEECLTFGNEEDEYAMVVRDFKKFFKKRGRFARQLLNDKNTFQRSRDDKNGKSDKKCFRCGDPNHLIGECLKPPKDKNQRAFVRGSWRNSGEEEDEKVKDETCLVAHASSEICLGVNLEPDEWIKDSGCSKHMMGNRKLFSTYKAYNGGNVIFGSNLRDNMIGKGQICDNKCRVTFSEHDSEITKDGKVIEFLHMDLFGPSAVRSYGGNRYTLVIVDDYSREFDNEVQFEEFCNANGITHNFSAPRTPQSDGAVERKNSTLQEMSRTMLNKQSLPQKFWRNTVDTSTYILNRILIRVILGKTPYELLKGYSQNSKAYIVLNKHTKKVKESLNMTFDETSLLSKTSALVDDDLDEEEAIKKQTALAISTTEAEYVSAGKACQQALWMKQALIDYDMSHNDHVLACLCYMLYCVANSEKFNLPISWKNEWSGLLRKLEQKPRKDRGTRRGRHSTSSSTFNEPSLSHLNDDDDDDGNNEGTSHASTPSPICYVNSLTNQVP
nr:zf-CCHC domain-containing protein/UBN2 domain-containing protein [Tanacetum cinerariifolium]